ncbi:hypothetical protein [Sorangium sp. So ce124]|uniref:hypothetical protein n=1 Tax=Sorangium sp. So ce124 TaxID=3133280 RepID=UPI003F636FCE
MKRPHPKHLLLAIPEDWTNDRKGDFFESFVADLLRPMRFAVERRLRVTGMEIDLLAKGLDMLTASAAICIGQARE